METKKQHEVGKNVYLRLYLLAISILAIAGMTIALGLIAFPSFQKMVVTDQEYAMNQWQYKNCQEPVYRPAMLSQVMPDQDGIVPEALMIERTVEEIQACQSQALTERISHRNYEFKHNLAMAFARFMVFVILFITHFPFFIRYNRDK